MSEYPVLKELKSKGVKLLIFDLDGTLLDSMNVWNKVDIDFLGRYGYEVTPEYTDVVKRVSVDEAALYTASPTIRSGMTMTPCHSPQPCCPTMQVL